MGSTSIMPTLPNAYCQTTADALIVFEAVLQRKILPVSRRPHDRERSDIVQSGNIFVFNETESGIKRWTDGVPWSPSRILGNFLIYRELSQPFPPGEKKRAQKRIATAAIVHNDNNLTTGPPGDFDRSLVGSLVDSYNFKRNGLVKKTISITADNGRQYHMISYYNPQDVLDGRLRRPGEVELLENIQPRASLTNQSNFRVNNEQEESPMSPAGDHSYPGSAYNIPHAGQQLSMRSSFSGHPPGQNYLSTPHSFGHSPMEFHGQQVGVTEHFARSDHSPFSQPPESQPRYQPSFSGGELRPQVTASTVIGSTDAYDSNWSATANHGALPPLNTGSLPAPNLGSAQYSDAAGYNPLSANPVNRASGSSYGSGSASWPTSTAYSPATPATAGRNAFSEGYPQSWNQAHSPQIKSTHEESDPTSHQYSHWPAQ